ncbi:MAG TPA: extracellular solute-binding protein [Methyloceanibacter sp.]|nr:extracellular solute-binding protein [Methyloceanibacter sp.]HZP09576.1 extracellular solute-binding protein [Methyloceanibacter sp.]
MLVLALLFLPGSNQARAASGIAMHGAPREEAGFAHFAYVDPNAPKGGRVIFAKQGSYDSVNPLIVKGEPAEGVRDYVYESLLARANDEPFTLYGLIAESVATPPDRSYVEFTLNPKAMFSDGVPITVADVMFSYALLRDHGRPNHRSYYKKVTKAEQTGERTVRFTFDGSGDREMPLIMGLMPVLPKHLIDPDTFENTTLKPLIGSGPYVIDTVDPGKSITFKRDPNYWGRDLPVNRGRFNFDEIRFDYYRDAGSMFEAFKSGLVQFREEDDPTRWSEGYDFPALRDGRVIKEELPIETPAGMAALVFNTRRPLFADQRVREALIRLFDFEWVNRTLYHGLYARTESYFARSDLSSHGHPADAAERALLAPYLDQVKPAVMDGSYALPESDGSGENREGRRAALELLEQAGYRLKEGKLVNAATGEPFSFEILAATRAQERLLLTYAAALKQVGIDARIRQVDSAQYQRRKQTYDFDMIQYYWPVSLSPGNEQFFRWGSEAAVTEGSFNYAGVKSKAVDAMIEAMLKAEDEDSFVSAVRALDRVLLSGDYVIPLFHLPRQWVAHWRELKRPEVTPLYGYQIDTWWMAPATPSAARKNPPEK